MEEININGKFKEDFIKWLEKASLNYIINFEMVEYYGYTEKIQILMKFLNNIPYGNSYYIEDYRVYSTEQMNELIENYNNANTI